MTIKKIATTVCVLLLISLIFSGCSDDSTEFYEKNIRSFAENLLTSDVDRYLSYLDTFGATEWQNEQQKLEVLTEYGLFEKFDDSCSSWVYSRLLEDIGCDIFTVSRYAYEYGFDSISPSEIRMTLEDDANETLTYLVECDLDFVKSGRSVSHTVKFNVYVNGWKGRNDSGLVGQYDFTDSLFLNPLPRYNAVSKGEY